MVGNQIDCVEDWLHSGNVTNIKFWSIVRSHQARHEAGAGYTTGLERQLPGLWCAQSMAAIAARRHWRCSLHSRAVDEKVWAAKYPARREVLNHGCGWLIYRLTDKVNREFAATRPNQLWVAGQPVIAHRFSTGCIGTGTVGAAENRGINSSQRSRLPIFALYGTADWGQYWSFCW